MPQVRDSLTRFVSAVMPDLRGIVRTRPWVALVIAAYVRGLSDRDIESLAAEAGPRHISRTTVRPEGPKEGFLVAWGYTTDGGRVLLDACLSQRGRLEDWLDLGRGLIRRGLRPPLPVISDVGVTSRPVGPRSDPTPSHQDERLRGPKCRAAAPATADVRHYSAIDEGGTRRLGAPARGCPRAHAAAVGQPSAILEEHREEARDDDIRPYAPPDEAPGLRGYPGDGPPSVGPGCVRRRNPTHHVVWARLCSVRSRRLRRLGASAHVDYPAHHNVSWTLDGTPRCTRLATREAGPRT